MEITSKTESQPKTNTTKNSANVAAAASVNSKALNDDPPNSNANNRRIQRSSVNIQFETSNAKNAPPKSVKKQTVSVKSIAHMTTGNNTVGRAAPPSDQTKPRTKTKSLNESPKKQPAANSYLNSSLTGPMIDDESIKSIDDNLLLNVSFVKPGDVFPLEGASILKLLTKSTSESLKVFTNRNEMLNSIVIFKSL